MHTNNHCLIAVGSAGGYSWDYGFAVPNNKENTDGD
jgi:hypothetical protein